MAIRIEQVDAGSEAEALGLAPGDELLSVDDNELNDTLDYDFYTDSSSFHLKARVADGIREWEVQRPQRGPFGCGFKTYLGDAKHSCSNHCMFCFIDQLPPGMRESLYFKDDDERLSFLFGNYITMTNMQDHEIDRIIKMHISPINISVHTTNPQLRVRMLANKRGGEVLKYLPRLVQGGIAVNCQLVLCRGINDGDELRRTLRDLTEWQFSSCSLVPVGITRYRQGLAKLRPVSAEDARDIIAIAEEFGQENLRRFGTRRFFCADELYLRAGLPLPQEDYYEGYRQLENGVGMLRSLEQDFLSAMRLEDPAAAPPPFTIATGTAAAPFLRGLLEQAKAYFPRLEGQVIAVENDFFGHTIDVAGLLTGQDLSAQLQRVPSLGRVLLPLHMLRHGETVFLDDYTVARLADELGCPVQIVGIDGGDLLDAMLDASSTVS